MWACIAAPYNPGFAEKLSIKEYPEGHDLHAYDDAEEYYIITMEEHPVAEKLGEDKRTTHSGGYVTVERATDKPKIETETKQEE